MREAGGAALRVVVRLPSVLRNHAGGAERLEVELPRPVTLAAVIDSLAGSHPAIARRLRDETGSLREHVNVFVGVDNVRDLQGLATEVPDGAEVSVLAAVSGGMNPRLAPLSRSSGGTWRG